jgi:hypothetical protein
MQTRLSTCLDNVSGTQPDKKDSELLLTVIIGVLMALSLSTTSPIMRAFRTSLIGIIK